MSKIQTVLRSILLTSLMGLSLPTLADDTSNSTQAPVMPNAPISAAPPPATAPCQNLVQACQAAGYFKGGMAQGKGLWKNCMHLLLLNQPVAGVTVNPADVQACQAKIAAQAAQPVSPAPQGAVMAPAAPVTPTPAPAAPETPPAQ